MRHVTGAPNRNPPRPLWAGFLTSCGVRQYTPRPRSRCNRGFESRRDVIASVAQPVLERCSRKAEVACSSHAGGSTLRRFITSTCGHCAAECFQSGRRSPNRHSPAREESSPGRGCTTFYAGSSTVNAGPSGTSK